MWESLRHSYLTHFCCRDTRFGWDLHRLHLTQLSIIQSKGSPLSSEQRAALHCSSSEADVAAKLPCKNYIFNRVLPFAVSPDQQEGD